jgi:hypothetical protein
MTNLTEAPDHRTEHKLTAAQILKDCPARLQQIGREITERLKKADKQTQLADDHVIAVNELLAEAKELCDSEGFNAFREKYCPTLGRSRAYAVLAIAAGKKTVEQDRAESRARQANKRASDRERADEGKYTREDVRDIVVNVERERGTDTALDLLRRVGGVEVDATTVADLKPEYFDKVYIACAEALALTQQLVRDITDKEVVPADAPSIVQDQKPEAAKPHRGVTSKDEALFDFTARVCDLIRRTGGQKPKRFAATAVKADDLARLGKFLTDLANLKKRCAKPTATVRGNDTVSVQQSAEDMKAKHAAPEAGGEKRKAVNAERFAALDAGSEA